jgi:hypothetical protein
MRRQLGSARQRLNAKLRSDCHIIVGGHRPGAREGALAHPLRLSSTTAEVVLGANFWLKFPFREDY